MADQVLLTEGPKTREELILLMMPLIPPGQAARRVLLQVDSHRRAGGYGAERMGTLAPRTDVYEQGRRHIAWQTLNGAVGRGTWLRDGDLITHRDWTPPQNTT